MYKLLEVLIFLGFIGYHVDRDLAFSSSLHGHVKVEMYHIHFRVISLWVIDDDIPVGIGFFHLAVVVLAFPN